MLERYINSRIIYNMLDEEAWNKYLNQNDPVIMTALKVFRDKVAFPQAPAPRKAAAKDGTALGKRNGAGKE